MQCRILFWAIGYTCIVTAQSTAGDTTFGLRLPSRPISDRFSHTLQPLEPGKPVTCATLDGPGCIQHLFVVVNAKTVPLAERQVVMRIYFDGATVPHVEAPLGDFFGVMHGAGWYPINTPLLSVKERSGFNSYFKMPFGRSARIEFESNVRTPLYLQVDWHRYPNQELQEPRRFCARWRREMPTQRYGEDFFMLDADGPGQLVGFVYGVRLIDQTDRWSHGGSDNIYLDGEGEFPAYLRGIGGEDSFGVGYGGALHTPETHLHSSIPYYVHEDVGDARPAQRVVGYRFFVEDTVSFEKSIHMRFGCMKNDICATVFWYQEGVPRPYVRLPDWKQLLPGTELPRGSIDLPLPDHGGWAICAPLDNEQDRAINDALRAAPLDSNPDVKWRVRQAYHGFIDFNHVFRPETKGVAVHHRGVAGQARCVLTVEEECTAELLFSWDDRLILQVNDQPPMDLGRNDAFRSRIIPVKLRKGRNSVLLTLSNSQGSNHGGWAFAMRATDSDGLPLLPTPAVPAGTEDE
ncbi:MAG: glycoside hydrolase family 172 protein [Pirellulales bacterium]